MRVSVLMTTAAVLAAACSSASGPLGGGGGGRTTSLTVGNDFFTPTPDTISAGQTATWTWNSGGRSHNVTFEDGQNTSPTQGSGTHQRTFSNAGTFRYRCTIHSTTFGGGMSGTIVVQ